MKNKKLIIAGCVVLAVAGSAAVFLFSRDDKPTNDVPPRQINTVDYGPPKSSDKISESSKDMLAKDDVSEDGQASPQKITVTISNTSQDSSTVYVRAITGSVASGECKLTMQQGVTSVVKIATLSTQADYGICQGFNIPKSELRAGSWRVHVNMTSGNISGSADTTIEVSL